MVCLACLLPLFLVPIINALPLLINFILAKVYGLLGWEYRKTERAPPACPFRPPTNKSSQEAGKIEEKNLVEPGKSNAADGEKQD